MFQIETTDINATQDTERNDADKCSQITTDESASKDETIRPSRAKKQKKNLDHHEDMMASAYNILKKVAQKPEATARPAIDECDSFGLFVTNKLKNYPPWVRSTVQHHISNILYAADQGRYDKRREYMCEYGFEQSNYSHSSATTQLPTPSPQMSLHSLDGSDASNTTYLPSENPEQMGCNYNSSSSSVLLNSTVATTLPSQSYTLTTLLSPAEQPTQSEFTQEGYAQESQDTCDDFSDLI